MKKKIFIIVGIILIAFLIGFFCFKLFKKSTNIIETYGNIEIRQVDLSFQVQGIINDIFKEEGDYVKKGQLLAILDDRDYRANYEKSKYSTISSQAQAKEDFDKYKRNYPLCLDGTISKQECDTLLNTKNNSQAIYKEKLATQNYQKNQLDYTKLYAPQDGIITTRAQEIGAKVAQGQTIYVMSLLKPVWVRTYIKETDLGNIKYGQKAYVYTDTIDTKTNKKKEYIGKIGYISPVAEFTPKTVQTKDLRVDLVYRIRVYIDDVDEFLRQGMPVTIKIKLNEE